MSENKKKYEESLLQNKTESVNNKNDDSNQNYNSNNNIDNKKQKKCKKKKKTKKPKRCEYENCKKRLTLVDYESICKCSKYYCMMHKSASNHNCTFDYRGEYMEKQDILISNMKIINKKMEVF